jgi:hypothetical protein
VAAFSVSASDAPRTSFFALDRPPSPGFPDLFITKGLAERALDLFISKELLIGPRGESCGNVKQFRRGFEWKKA